MKARASVLCAVLALSGCGLVATPQGDPDAQRLQNIQDVKALQVQVETIKGVVDAERHASPMSQPALDKASVTLQQITDRVNELSAKLAAAPTLEDQQRVAREQALLIAQQGARDFGGPYGGLIAAALGLIGLVVQGVVNSKNAHKTAQANAQIAGAALSGGRPPTSVA